MTWQSTKEAVPWVGLYVAVASLVCTLAMGADVFQGFRQRKLWFPCRFFTLNAASITLIAIAMKLPMDLSDNPREDNIWSIKGMSIYFLFTMLANFLPSLGEMDDKELFTNLIALGIFIITFIVNLSIQVVVLARSVYVVVLMSILAFFLLWPFWVALTVPAFRRVLEHQYQEFHTTPLDCQQISFSSGRLIHHVKKYWIMAETGNPQFVLASSPFSSASGLICFVYVTLLIRALIEIIFNPSNFWNGKSDYKWSNKYIFYIQLIGTVVGSIAPIFRFITTATYFNISIRWSINHINMFRVEKHWAQRLRQWKRIHASSHIPGRHCKKVFNHVKNMILNFCIALQITLVVICKTICLVPTCIVLLFYSLCHFCNSLLKRFRVERDATNNNVRSEIHAYNVFVLQIEEEAKLSKRKLRNMLKSVAKLLHHSEKKQPRNLLKLLEKSTGFNGVANFDNDQVLPFYREELEKHNCWSLVVVTLTVVALSLPNIENNQVNGLLATMSEGLQFVRHIEETLDANGDLVKTRKTARRLWTELEIYCSWLQIDLQKKARKGEMSKKILQWLGDEAVQIVIKFKRKKRINPDDSFHKFIAASSMYRISQTILLYEQENSPTDLELFEWISTIIADLLCACFTNLPRVITLKCHHDAIEKRGESIRSAARLLGKSKTILNILEGRQLPDLDMESMAYVDKWRALPKSQIPNDPTSSAGIRSASSSSNELVTITTM